MGPIEDWLRNARGEQPDDGAVPDRLRPEAIRRAARRHRRMRQLGVAAAVGVAGVAAITPFTNRAAESQIKIVSPSPSSTPEDSPTPEDTPSATPSPTPTPMPTPSVVESASPTPAPLVPTIGTVGFHLEDIDESQPTPYELVFDYTVTNAESVRVTGPHYDHSNPGTVTDLSHRPFADSGQQVFGRFLGGGTYRLVATSRDGSTATRAVSVPPLSQWPKVNDATYRTITKNCGEGTAADHDIIIDFEPGPADRVQFDVVMSSDKVGGGDPMKRTYVRTTLTHPTEERIPWPCDNPDFVESHGVGEAYRVLITATNAQGLETLASGGNAGGSVGQ
jgi:hypothetical protein